MISFVEIRWRDADPTDFETVSGDLKWKPGSLRRLSYHPKTHGFTGQYKEEPFELRFFYSGGEGVDKAFLVQHAQTIIGWCESHWHVQ